MDLPTFFSKTKNLIMNILKKESTRIRSQTTTWIRFMKDNEYVDLQCRTKIMAKVRKSSWI